MRRGKMKRKEKGGCGCPSLLKDGRFEATREDVIGQARRMSGGTAN